MAEHYISNTDRTSCLTDLPEFVKHQARWWSSQLTAGERVDQYGKHFRFRAKLFKRKAKVAQFRVFELHVKGANSYRNVSPTTDLLAITTTTWQLGKEKRPPEPIPAAFVKLWLPTVDNLRNFFLTPSAEMISFFQILQTQ